MSARITVKQAARLLGVSELTVRMGLLYETLPIGTYIKHPDHKRTIYHIAEGKLANYLNITVEELKERVIQ